MQPTDYFSWNADPTAIDFGTLPLPFPVAIWGLVAAVIIFIYGLNKLEPDQPEKSRGSGQDKSEPAGWKLLALLGGSLAIGQLLFLLLPSPTLSELGPIQVRWYGLMFASAFIVGYIIERRMYLNAGRTEEELEKLLTYVLIATIVGARLGHVIFYDLGYYLRHPDEIIAIWHGGLASHGAAVGIIAAMYLYAKKMKGMSFYWVADRVVVTVATGGAFIRTGNFFNSEIIGEPSTLPWAVIFERVDMIPRHPTMLYEALLCLVTFGVLWTMYKRYRHQPPEGSLFGTFLVLLFSGRFLLEFTKVDQAEFAASWAINMGQWLSVPLIAFGAWLLFKKVNWSQTPGQPESAG